NFTNNYLMEQHMPFTIVDTTDNNQQECINQVTEDMLKLNTIWNSYRICTTCNQHNCNVTFPIALPRGNIRAKYMVVGQNPAGRGKSNHKYITMFNDSSGSGIIIDVLKKAGIYLDCWFTNIVQCSTSDNKINNYQVEECKLILSLEIEHIKPKKIFALGNETYKYMKQHFSELNIVKVKHPAYVKRFYSKKPDKIEEYINKFQS
ncbi:MAG: uracil-DNA glycosylase family protein, partial [archaeon]